MAVEFTHHTDATSAVEDAIARFNPDEGAMALRIAEIGLREVLAALAVTSARIDIASRSAMERAWRLALGAHDYNGGYSGDQLIAFHHGIETVANVLRAVVAGERDLQIRAVEANGARKAEARAADAEAGALTAVDGCKTCPMSVDRTDEFSAICQLAGVTFDTENSLPVIAPNWCPLRAGNGAGVLVRLGDFCDAAKGEAK